MAGKLFNRGGLDLGLAEYLGLKGRLNGSVESEIRPVIIVSDLSSGPYARDYTPWAGEVDSLPAVTDYGYVGVRPSVGTCLQIKRIDVQSLEASPGHTFFLQLLTGQAVNAIAAAGSTSLTAARKTRQEFGEVVSDPILAGPQMVNLTSTVNDVSGIIGRYNAPASAVQPALVIEFPDPGILIIRRSAANLGGLFYHGQAIGVDAIVNMYGNEWPLPG